MVPRCVVHAEPLTLCGAESSRDVVDAEAGEPRGLAHHAPPDTHRLRLGRVSSLGGITRAIPWDRCGFTDYRRRVDSLVRSARTSGSGATPRPGPVGTGM